MSEITIEKQEPRTKICTSTGCLHSVCLAVKRKEKEEKVNKLRNEISDEILSVSSNESIPEFWFYWNPFVTKFLSFRIL